MTPEQFDRFLETVSNRQEDHDLLIEIRTIMKGSTEKFDRHYTDDASNFGKVELSLKALHTRVDNVFRIRDRVAGALALIGFLCMVGTFLLNWIKFGGHNGV